MAAEAGQEGASAGRRGAGLPGTLIRTGGYGSGGERWQRQYVKFRTPHGKYLGEIGAAEISSPPDKAGKHEMLSSLFLLASIISRGNMHIQQWF